MIFDVKQLEHRRNGSGEEREAGLLPASRGGEINWVAVKIGLIADYFATFFSVAIPPVAIPTPAITIRPAVTIRRIAVPPVIVGTSIPAILIQIAS